MIDWPIWRRVGAMAGKRWRKVGKWTGKAGELPLGLAGLDFRLNFEILWFVKVKLALFDHPAGEMLRVCSGFVAPNVAPLMLEHQRCNGCCTFSTLKYQYAILMVQNKARG